uniref:G-protein coupled receptors family 1 profile domain-containing protein n=1 Tax=Equus caballus TaxID=9796 RepID=A0A9L0RT47_HORSE
MLRTSDWPSSAEVRRAMGSHTTVTEFVLLGLSDACELQMLLFLGLHLTYLLTLPGNLLILVVTLRDWRFHTSMYYFFCKFAALQIWLSSVIFPKMLTSILTGHMTISLAGCFLQLFLYFFLGNTEFLLLVVMSFDSQFISKFCGLHLQNIFRTLPLLFTTTTTIFVCTTCHVSRLPIPYSPPHPTPRSMEDGRVRKHSKESCPRSGLS